ncbi:MAG: hypothetical protein ABIS17_12845 [Casimicrobiaceae bacterium]
MRPSSMVRMLLTSAVLATSLAHAATDSELTEIREEIRSLKSQYEARIRALEDKLRAAEAAFAALAHPRSSAATPPPAAASAGIAAFNPAISLVLQGTYANLRQDPLVYALAGFAKTDDVSPGGRGLALGESELTFSANVDDRFAGNLTLSLTPENTVSVEEAYGFMPSLGNGVVPKFGRFFSGIGYLNEQHQHAWDFYDAPLAYQALLGGQFTQDGAQVKWIAPLDQFVELGAELGNGDAFPGSSRSANGAGAASIFGHVGGDLGTSHSWRAGLSYLQTRARDRAATQLDASGSLADVAYTGKSRVAIADFVWKYAPNGNTREQSFKLQGEYLWRRETGDLTYDPSGGASVGAYRSGQSGWYLQGVYQFMPAWRAGLRYDRLDPGRPDYGANADLLDIGTFHPDRGTVMLDYSPSEFTRWRLQYAQSRTRPDVTDHQLYLQYILTLGAHGGHKY